MGVKVLAIGGLVAVLSAVVALLLLRPAPAMVFSAEPAPFGAVTLPSGVAGPRLQPVQPASAPALLNDVPAAQPQVSARLFSAAKADTRPASETAYVADAAGCGD